MPDWILRNLPEGWGSTEFWIAAVALTVTTFILSIIAVGVVMVRLPFDYFVGDHAPRMWGDRHPLVRWPLITLKNLLGLFLVVLGVVMSFPGVPGQGILTILMGVMILNFPGKRRFEKWLLRRRGVHKTINRFRARYGKPPLQLDTPPPSP